MTQPAVRKPQEKKAAPVEIHVGETYYRELNQELRRLVADGTRQLRLKEVYGQRYIGTDLKGDLRIDIEGTPGNDLGAFMDGPVITVRGNAQDGVGNTMNRGEIVIHGHAGDVLGMAMRGGAIYVRDDVGYRAGIHMKEYREKIPAIVIGGTAQDFFCEYMAGGVAILLGLTLKRGEPHRGRYIGTGMHAGTIYLRGSVEDHQLGREIGRMPLTVADREIIEKHVERYVELFDVDPKKLYKSTFTKLAPISNRPYGKLYAY